MSVVYHHPLPPSCTSPFAHNHPGSTHSSLQWRWRRARPTRSSLSSSPSSSSSYFKFPHSLLRCVYHHPAPADTIPTLLSSTRHPGFSNKGPFFAAQPFWRCNPGVGDGVSIIAPCARLPVSGSTLPHGLPDGATTVWGHRAGVSPLRRQQPSTSQVAAAGQPPSSKKEDKLVTEGLVTELLPGCMFRVRLDSGGTILGYVSGKMRSRMVKVIVGDRVTIEVDRFDSSRGRIVYRLSSKEALDEWRLSERGENWKNQEWI